MSEATAHELVGTKWSHLGLSYHITYVIEAVSDGKVIARRTPSVGIPTDILSPVGDTVEWDLAAFAESARGVTTFGNPYVMVPMHRWNWRDDPEWSKKTNMLQLDPTPDTSWRDEE